MDTQSRGVRLPPSGRIKSNAYANGISHRYSDANGYGNSDSHGSSISNADCHGYCYPDTVRQTNSDSETSSDYTPAPVVL